MKSRVTVILVAILIMLGAIALILVHGQKTAAINAVASLSAAATPVVRIQVQNVPPVVTATPSPAVVTSGSVEQPTPIPAASAAALKSGEEDKPGYTAVQGDTLSQVAAGLYGHDSKKNRDAAMAANASLKADPDRVLDGKTYQPSAPPVVAAPAAPQPEPAVAATPPETGHADSDRVLKYTAQPGDSVSALAAGLLGADSKTNRDAIINENKSLRQDPDHVETGKAYKIPVQDGLSAAPVAEAPAAPTTQPDADQVVKDSAGRELRYKARAGDTVSKLAEVLLGSDTQSNRDAIINNNASLKSDPDHVVAGQTYWIPAPVGAVVQQP